jgi:hypothetical protein
MPGLHPHQLYHPDVICALALALDGCHRRHGQGDNSIYFLAGLLFGDALASRAFDGNGIQGVCA